MRKKDETVAMKNLQIYCNPWNRYSAIALVTDSSVNEVIWQPQL